MIIQDHGILKIILRNLENKAKEIVELLKNFSFELENNILDKNVELIEESILPNFIINRLRGTTLIEIEKNVGIYNSILDVLSIMTSAYSGWSNLLINETAPLVKTFR